MHANKNDLSSKYEAINLIYRKAQQWSKIKHKVLHQEHLNDMPGVCGNLLKPLERLLWVRTLQTLIKVLRFMFSFDPETPPCFTQFFRPEFQKLSSSNPSIVSQVWSAALHYSLTSLSHLSQWGPRCQEPPFEKILKLILSHTQHFHA